jgi:hypothetical protein
MQTATISRERFLQLAQEELSAFERHECEFRQKDRQERAAELRISLNPEVLR